MRGKIEFEVGFYSCRNVFVAMWKAAHSAWSSWHFQKAKGGDPTRSYGVYLTGTEVMAASTGPMDGSLERAQVCCEAFNNRYGQEA